MWLGNAVTSSTLLADPPSNETIDVFYIKNEWQKAVPLWCMLQVGPPSLHYCYAVVLCSSIVLPPVGHSSNHEYHCCRLIGQSRDVSNFYHTFKVFIGLTFILKWHRLGKRGNILMVHGLHSGFEIETFPIGIHRPLDRVQNMKSRGNIHGESGRTIRILERDIIGRCEMHRKREPCSTRPVHQGSPLRSHCWQDPKSEHY